MMFKVLLVAVAFVAVVNAQSRTTPVSYTTCSMSGDPHFTTFDGVYHDFQGEGVYQATKNDYFNTQYRTLRCNYGAATYVVCVAATTTQIYDPNNATNSAVVSWVSWPGNSTNIVIDGVTQPVANLRTTPATVHNGFAKVTFDGSNVVVAGIKGDWKVVTGTYYLAVTIPFSFGFFKAYGTCGYVDGQANNDFSYANGTIAVPGTVAGSRYNSVAVNNWGASFAVGGRAGLPAIASKHVGWSMQGKLELLDDVPDPVIPTPEQQAALEKVPFTDLNAYTQAQAQCSKNAQFSNELDLQNCIYDAAVLNDLVLANSNEAVLAAVAAVNENPSSSSDSGLNGGAIAGIVLGCVAFVAIVAAFVLYYRLRVVSAAYSRALVVRSSAQDVNTPAATLGDNL